MRRRWLIVWLCALFSLAMGVTAFAQERSQQPSASEQDSSAPWRLTNFLIFALGLGWFVSKKGPSLAETVKHLRDQGAIEMEQVHHQILRQTEQQIQHIRESTSAETEALQAEGRRRVKRHMAGLTLSLAEQRLRKHLSEAEPDNLFQDFVNLVERGKN
jgi:hypothetical protein